MLGRRLRRRANIKSVLVYRVYAGWDGAFLKEKWQTGTNDERRNLCALT